MKDSSYSFWKPVKKTAKIKSFSLFNNNNSNKMKPFSPVKLSMYPSRSKQEWRLIDKKPFSDSDRDHSINIFDCKPLNKRKQGKFSPKKKPYTLYQHGTNKAKIVMSPVNPSGEESYAKGYGFAEGPFKNKSEARERMAAMHHVEEERVMPGWKRKKFAPVIEEDSRGRTVSFKPTNYLKKNKDEEITETRAQAMIDKNAYLREGRLNRLRLRLKESEREEGMGPVSESRERKLQDEQEKIKERIEKKEAEQDYLNDERLDKL